MYLFSFSIFVMFYVIIIFEIIFILHFHTKVESAKAKQNIVYCFRKNIDSQYYERTILTFLKPMDSSKKIQN